MKQTAIAPANIAFIKYWGKADAPLRLPLNPSVSMNLSGAHTTTTVEFSPAFTKDFIELADGTFSESEKNRIKKGLDRIRDFSKTSNFARVVTKNSFPKGAGAASSASGFAALTVAGFAAVGCALSERELTIQARIGSGSACRSIPDGFVQWEQGKVSADSFAYSLYPHTHWDVRDILVIVQAGMKKISTSDGMELVHTSPKLQDRLLHIPARMTKITNALAAKKFNELGDAIEEDCLECHAVMQSQTPAVMYWTETTKHLMAQVVAWRRRGIPVYFTIDAGPNIHLICQAIDVDHVLDLLKVEEGIENIIVNAPAPGTRLVEDHLF